MIQDLGNSIFDNQYKNYIVRPNDKLIICANRSVMLKQKDGIISFPSYKEIKQCNETRYLFSINETRYFMATNVVGLDEKYKFENVECFRTALPKEERFAGITGYQLYMWYDSTRFCSRCGSLLVHSEKERMLECPECKKMNYPTISPAVIVGIVNGDKILMTKYQGREYKNYALVAGFTEIGETLEQTVKREVMEEVDLKVKNIRYYDCQPWSFSNTMLIGFFCDLEGEDKIKIDEEELSCGLWVKCSEMEDILDDDITLTRKMMMEFKNNPQKFGK